VLQKVQLFCRAYQILIALKRYRHAEDLFKEIKRYIKNERERSINPSLLEDELEELTNLVGGIKMECGPIPRRTPILSEKMAGWYSFNASIDANVENAVKRNEHPTIELWRDDNNTGYPDITKLHLDISEDIGLDGLHNLFPNLTHLVLDDSKECIRICYILDELQKYALKLEYLEVNLSCQWMAEGDDVLEPIASLVNLRELRIQRRRDGATNEFKHLESLKKLERLFFWGCNRLDFIPDFDPYKTPDPETLSQDYVLDLSRLETLKSVVFIETSFSHISEKGNESQVLILPLHVKHVACIDIYGSKWSKLLLKDLKKRGLNVYTKDIFKLGESQELWKEIDNLYGGWYPLE